MERPSCPDDRALTIVPSRLPSCSDDPRAGGRFGRFVAYVWCVLVLVQGFLTIGQAPWYSALMITVGLLVTFGLATSGGQAEGDWS